MTVKSVTDAKAAINWLGFGTLTGPKQRLTKEDCAQQVWLRPGMEVDIYCAAGCFRGCCTRAGDLGWLCGEVAPSNTGSLKHA